MAVESQSSSASTPWPALLPLGHHAGKPPIPLNRNVTLVGSRNNAHLHLLSRSVSKAHALIVVSESGVYIRDLASRTHVLINNQAIREADLRDGDLLQIGGFTFRFSAGPSARRPSRAAGHLPAVLDTDDGQQYVIRERVLLIGRRPTSDLPLFQESVSTAHAVIFTMDGRWYLRDLGSRTGTFVNDQNMRKAELAPGDVIRIGDTELRFGLGTADMLAPEEAADAAALSALAPGVPPVQEEEEPEAAPPPPAQEPAPEPISEPTAELPTTSWRRPLATVRPPDVQPPPAEQPLDEVSLEAEERQMLADARPHAEHLTSTGTYAQAGAAEADEPHAMPEPSLEEVDEHEVPEEVAAADTALAATPPAAPAEPVVPVEAEEPAAVEPPLERREQEPLPPIPIEMEKSPSTPMEATIPPAVVPPPEPLPVQPAAEMAPAQAEPVKAPEPVDLSPIDQAVPPLPLDEPLFPESEQLQPPPPPARPAPAPPPTEPVEEPAPKPPPGRSASWGQWIKAVEPAAMARAAAAPVVPVAPATGGAAGPPAPPAPPAPTAPPPPVEPLAPLEPVDADIPTLTFDESASAPAALAVETPADDLVLSPEDAAASIMEELRKAEEQASSELDFSLPEEPLPSPVAPFAEPAGAAALDFAAANRQAAQELGLSLDEPLPLEVQPPVEPPPPPPPAPAPSAEEVVEATQPLPESAQCLEDVLGEQPPAPPTPPQDFDTVAREMSQLDSDLAGTPVEEPAPAAETPEAPESEPHVFPPLSEPASQRATIPEAVIEEPEAAIDQNLLEQALEELSQAQGEQPPVEETPVPAEPQPADVEPPTEPPVAVPEPLAAEPDDAEESPPPYDQAALEEALAALSAPPPEPQAVEPAPPETTPQPVQPPPPAPRAEAPAAPAPAGPSDFDRLMEDVFGWAPSPKATLAARAVSAPGPGPQFVPMPVPGAAPAPPPPTPAPQPPAAEPNESDLDQMGQEARGPDAAQPAPSPAPLSPQPLAEAPKPQFVVPPPPGPRPGPTPPVAGVTFTADPASFLGGVPLNLRPAPGPRPGRGQRGASAFSQGFDQREVDVFSEMPIAGPEVEKELGEITSDVEDAMLGGDIGMAGGQSPFADSAPSSVRPSGPQRGTMTAAPGVTGAALEPPTEDLLAETEPAETEPQPRPAARAPAAWTPSRSAPPPPRTRGRLVLLMVLMLICMIAAGLAVLYYFRPTISVSGKMHFERLGMLDAIARRAFQDEQELRLGNEARKAAAAQVKNNGLAPGFLADVSAYNTRRRVEWTQADRVNTRGTMTFTFAGDDSDDPRRVQSLLAALYAAEANQARLRVAQEARQKIAELRQQRTSAEASVKLLDEQVREERAVLDADPSDAQVRALRQEVTRLEQSWGAAMSARQALQAELDQLQRSAPAQTTMPAPDNDPKLLTLLKNLEQLNTRLTTARGSAHDAAAQARKSLDSSIEDFQKTMEAAQAVLKDSPALAAYVAAAQRLHEGTRKLAGDLIQRQQRLQEQLAEYKQRMDEQMESRRRELWEKDPEMKNLQQMLELKTREHNAAVASHLDKEAQERKTEIDEINEQIKVRRVFLGEDEFYNKAIQDIQQIIAGLERQLADDRKDTETMMAGLEKELAATTPQVERLPDEQKGLAARLAEKVAAMNAARRAYAQAVSAQHGTGAGSAQELEAQVRLLEDQVEARKRELAAAAAGKLTREQEQARAAAIQQKRSQLDAARQQESAAQAALREKQQALTTAMARGEGSRAQREKFEELVRRHAAAQKDLEKVQQELDMAQASLDVAVEPQAPESVSFTRDEGHRAIYAGGAVIVVAVVFGALIMLLVPLGGRQTPVPVVSADGFDADQPADPFALDDQQELSPSDSPGRSART